MSTEKWMPVVGYEGYYEISSNGNVRSLDRKTKSRTAFGQTIKPAIQNSGYLFVSLHKSGASKNFLIHRLVATAFISNNANKKYVNHINGVKTDNQVKNLEWCTFSENIQHSYDNGARKISAKHISRLRKFNTESKSIPVSQFTKDGRFVASFKSAAEASAATGFDYTGIRKCANGKLATCGKHVWKHAKNITP